MRGSAHRSVQYPTLEPLGSSSQSLPRDLRRTRGIILKEGGGWSFFVEIKEGDSYRESNERGREEVDAILEQRTSKAKQGWEGLESSARGGRHFLRVHRVDGKRQELARGSAKTIPLFQSGRI